MSAFVADPPKEEALPYQIWPCQSVGKPGNYSVARPGGQPVFVAGAYHWPKAEAEAIRDRLNKGQS